MAHKIFENYRDLASFDRMRQRDGFGFSNTTHNNQCGYRCTVNGVTRYFDTLQEAIDARTEARVVQQ